MSNKDKKYLILYASVGNGHTSSAQAIADMLIAQGVPKEAITLYDACNLGRVVRVVFKHFYSKVVRWIPALYQLAYRLGDTRMSMKFIEFILSFYNDRLVAVVDAAQPDIIVSTFPMTSMMAAYAKRAGDIQQPVVSVVTDLIAHHVWVSHGIEWYWVMNEATAQSLCERGVPRSLIIAGGIPINHCFTVPFPRSKNELRARWGLEPDRCTILISNWIVQPAHLLQLLHSLNPLADKIACFVLCGKSEEAKAFFEQYSYPFPVKFFGFVDFVSDLMEASDLLIGKAGGLTICESLAKGVPLVVFNPVYGQERDNVEFLASNKAIFMIDKPADIERVVQQILADPHALAQRRALIRSLAKPEAAHDIVQFLFSLSLK